MRVSALSSSSDEDSFAERDEEAPWANLDLPASVLRVLVDYCTLSVDFLGELANKLIKELLVLEEESSDRFWAAELLGFCKSEWSEHIMNKEERKFLSKEW